MIQEPISWTSWHIERMLSLTRLILHKVWNSIFLEYSVSLLYLYYIFPPSLCSHIWWSQNRTGPNQYELISLSASTHIERISYLYIYFISSHHLRRCAAGGCRVHYAFAAALCGVPQAAALSQQDAWCPAVSSGTDASSTTSTPCPARAAAPVQAAWWTMQLPATIGNSDTMHHMACARKRLQNNSSC